MATTVEPGRLMHVNGAISGSSSLAAIGIRHAADVYWNRSIPRLIEEALARGEGELAANGALTAQTGKYTGRSPGDKFVVDHPSYHDRIWWGNVNQPMTPEAFDRLHGRVCAYLQ